ncbi:MAG: toxin-antitoxin system, antitoxin component, Xre family protein [Clostridia bacterium]|nr:toxin-antitoxin system, antitoxin component, Xre family protein [Clostridia bacterium]MBQ3463439.1 toxin-antitoxin system, antitoxin component, Xre family protein [Clostridia bacterium]
MTDTKLLELAIVRAGVTKREIAKALNISETALYAKIKGVREFKASEIIIIQRLLNLSNEERDRIFFADSVENNSTLSE